MTDLKLLARRAAGMTLGLALASVACQPAFGQVKTTVPDVVAGARPARMERITIHGKALEGNLEGNAIDRTVLVILPPSYAADRNRRYPVVYGLHGYSIGAEQWSQEIHVPQTVEGAFAKGTREMIVVHNGSMYSSSVVLAKWAANSPLAFVDQYVQDLRQYRAIAIDVGDMDNLKAGASKLHDVLKSYGITTISRSTRARTRAMWPSAFKRT